MRLLFSLREAEEFDKVFIVIINTLSHPCREPFDTKFCMSPNSKLVSEMAPHLRKTGRLQRKETTFPH